jgi:hypothetical protein
VTILDALSDPNIFRARLREGRLARLTHVSRGLR